jgi:hypothetical protein
MITPKVNHFPRWHQSPRQIDTNFDGLLIHRPHTGRWQESSPIRALIKLTRQKCLSVWSSAVLGSINELMGWNRSIDHGVLNYGLTHQDDETHLGLEWRAYRYMWSSAIAGGINELIERNHSAEHGSLSADLDPPHIGATMSNKLHGRLNQGRRIFPKFWITRSRSSDHPVMRSTGKYTLYNCYYLTRFTAYLMTNASNVLSIFLLCAYTHSVQTILPKQLHPIRNYERTTDPKGGKWLGFAAHGSWMDIFLMHENIAIVMGNHKHPIIVENFMIVSRIFAENSANVIRYWVWRQYSR